MKIRRLLIMLALCSGTLVFLSTGKASASHLSPPSNVQMPAYIRQGFQQDCGHSGQSPAFRQWVSAAGAPSVTTINVPYGATPVDLALHFAGMVCYSNSAVPEARLQTRGASATPPGTFSGIIGQVLSLNWGSAYQNVGWYRGASRNFRFTPTGGFRTGNYTIRLDNRVINRFTNGTYQCVTPPSPQVGGWNYAACPVAFGSFTIRVNVAPRPVDAGSCGVSAPTLVYPGESFNASFSARNSGTNGGFAWPVNNGQPGRYRLREVGSWPGGPEMEIQGSGVTQTGFGPILYPGRSTNWPPPAIAAFAAPGTPGSYTFSWRIYGSNSLDGFHYVGSPCTITIQVVERPYHKVYGGDVLAAGAFGEPCYDTDARIIGWNDSNSAVFGLSVGSGSQLAAMALGAINEFGSGQARNDADPPNVNMKNLTFANTPPGNYGGELGDEYATCAPDYWANASGVQTGNTAIGNTNLGMGQRVTRYIEGDVHITGNITQANGAFNGINQVPSYRLIVRGDIYIAPGVSELNGLFVAIPTDATDGRIYTCSNGFAPPTTAQVAGGACQNRLTVYGAVVADLIKFSRSGGSLRYACRQERFNVTCPSGQLPAERFIYTPETWLTSDFSADDADVDSIRTLPPIL
jgi:hypothetical protein